MSSGTVCGKAPEAGEVSRLFVLKITLQSVRLLLTVSYRKTGGAGCTSCSSNNFVGGAPRVPAPICRVYVVTKFHDVADLSNDPI